MSVKRGNKPRRLLAEQVWADDKTGANATVLNDYRHWVEELDGLTPRYGWHDQFERIRIASAR